MRIIIKFSKKITQNAFMIQCVLRRKEADEDEIKHRNAVEQRQERDVRRP